MKVLDLYFLHINRFARIPSNVFEKSGSDLQFVTLANQDPYVNGSSQYTIVLEEGAFNGVNRENCTRTGGVGVGTRLILTEIEFKLFLPICLATIPSATAHTLIFPILGSRKSKITHSLDSRTLVNLVGNAVKLPTSISDGIS